MAKVQKPTQADRVLAYLDEYGSITQLEALRDLGIMRLASRVSDLRKLGFPIVGDIVPVKNRFDEYSYIKRYRMEWGNANG